MDAAGHNVCEEGTMGATEHRPYRSSGVVNIRPAPLTCEVKTADVTSGTDNESVTSNSVCDADMSSPDDDEMVTSDKPRCSHGSEDPNDLVVRLRLRVSAQTVGYLSVAEEINPICKVVGGGGVLHTLMPHCWCWPPKSPLSSAGCLLSQVDIRHRYQDGPRANFSPCWLPTWSRVVYCATSGLLEEVVYIREDFSGHKNLKFLIFLHILSHTETRSRSQHRCWSRGYSSHRTPKRLWLTDVEITHTHYSLKSEILSSPDSWGTRHDKWRRPRTFFTSRVLPREMTIRKFVQLPAAADSSSGASPGSVTHSLHWCRNDVASLLVLPGGVGGPTGERGTGDPRENSTTNGIVRHDFRLRKSGLVTLPHHLVFVQKWMHGYGSPTFLAGEGYLSPISSGPVAILSRRFVVFVNAPVLSGFYNRATRRARRSPPATSIICRFIIKRFSEAVRWRRRPCCHLLSCNISLQESLQRTRGQHGLCRRRLASERRSIPTFLTVGGHGGRAVRLLASQGYPGPIPGRFIRIFACGNRAVDAVGPVKVEEGGGLGELSFPSPFHSVAAPYSPSFTLIGSQDLATKSRPNLITSLYIFSQIMLVSFEGTCFWQKCEESKSPAAMLDSWTSCSVIPVTDIITRPHVEVREAVNPEALGWPVLPIKHLGIDALAHKTTDTMLATSRVEPPAAMLPASAQNIFVFQGIYITMVSTYVQSPATTLSINRD
ncbi:hypothetical protein PR048_012626 [Dryococelus australis]|uniref:Uncharacterized protein n=1 Tax=Dryococelus australis TaxID=614101 RepID=A0ABQ9HQ61_9NEOP|nr:hypothetical protein PR048_012626 [Dryococelus australis]